MINPPPPFFRLLCHVKSFSETGEHPFLKFGSVHEYKKQHLHKKRQILWEIHRTYLNLSNSVDDAGDGWMDGNPEWHCCYWSLTLSRLAFFSPHLSLSVKNPTDDRFRDAETQSELSTAHLKLSFYHSLIVSCMVTTHLQTWPYSYRDWWIISKRKEWSS